METLEKIQKLQTALLPDEFSLMEIIDECLNVLEGECNFPYRPKNKEEKSGGLLDFYDSSRPVIVIPDLHGRRSFLPLLLQKNVELSDENEETVKGTVYELLKNGSVIVVCVGDIWHTETPGECAQRWGKAFEEWEAGVTAGEFIVQEMEDSIGTLLQVMELKKAFPENFHVLKGNHENVLNEDGHGNHSFRKYVFEGHMVRDFIQDYYSDATLHLINLFEKTLPVCALFKGFGVSHAEPKEAFTRNKVINSSFNDDVILGLTWTGNNEVFMDTVPEFYKKLGKEKASGLNNVFWLSGHRPVEGKYQFRQGRYLVQFHNPFEMNVVAAIPGKEFSEEKIISLGQ